MASQEFLKLLSGFESNPSPTLLEWQRQLNHIFNNLTSGSYVTTSAVNVTVTDILGLLTSVNVEAALAELANSIVSGTIRITTLTGTTLLTIAQFGLVICNSGSAMTLNLPTAVGNTGLGYIVNNIGAGTVTIDPATTELLQGDSTFDLYTNEIYGFTSNNVGWVIST